MKDHRHFDDLQESRKILKTMKILFSTVPITVGRGKTKIVNIADIPMELSLLGRHFFKEIEQMSKHSFSVKQFLDDVCCKLITTALQASVAEDMPALASDIAIRSLLVTGPKSRKLDDSTIEIDVDDRDLVFVVSMCRRHLQRSVHIC